MRQYYFSRLVLACLLTVSLIQPNRVNAQDQVLRQASFDWQDPESGNPLMGYALQAEKSQVDSDIQLLYVDVTWKELEPQKGKYNFEAIEKANQFERWRKEGKHLVLRFVLDLPGQDRHQDIPDWLYQAIKGAGDWYHTDYGQGFSPDYSQEALITAHDKAVAAMGQRWGQDGFVSFIELGSVGHWGEWHVNYEKGLKRLPSEDILERYVVPWRTAFPKTQILMRRPFKWGQTYQLGLYNDMVGEEINTSQWLEWIQAGGVYDQTQNKSLLAMPQAWKTLAIGGEMTSAHSMEDLMGSRLQEVLKHVKASHMTFIGPKAPKADLGQAAYKQILSQLGYQIYVSQAQLAQKGQEQTMTLTFENKGAAPFYYDWPLYLYLQDGQGKELKKIEVPLTLSQLVPGRQETVSVALNLSSQESSQAGHYQYSLGIVDPMTGKDALRLAMPGYDDQTGRTILFPTQ